MENAKTKILSNGNLQLVILTGLETLKTILENFIIVTSKQLKVAKDFPFVVPSLQEQLELNKFITEMWKLSLNYLSSISKIIRQTCSVETPILIKIVQQY